MSSRNARLNENQRQNAPFIYKTLLETKNIAGEKSVSELKTWVENIFNSNKEFKLEYFEISDSVDLQTVSDWEINKSIMGFVVANMGNVRLIDNIRLFNNFADSKEG